MDVPGRGARFGHGLVIKSIGRSVRSARMVPGLVRSGRDNKTQKMQLIRSVTVHACKQYKNISTIIRSLLRNNMNKKLNLWRKEQKSMRRTLDSFVVIRGSPSLYSPWADRHGWARCKPRRRDCSAGCLLGLGRGALCGLGLFEGPCRLLKCLQRVTGRCRVMEQFRVVWQ